MGPRIMHPTNGKSMLLTVHQGDLDPSNEPEKDEKKDVSEDELDMILATMGTTSLDDSELALLQDDVDSQENEEEELDIMLATMGTTSLDDSEIALLQNDVDRPENESEGTPPVEIDEKAGGITTEEIELTEK